MPIHAMKVFLSVTSFRPAYGGPARSVSRLAAALAQVGLEVGVWAPDQSAIDTIFLPKDGAVQRLRGNAVEALEEFGKADLIHDNGIWLPHNHRIATLARTLGIPRVVSTRGMLEPWSLNHKRLKKRIAWALYQEKDLRKADGLHVTSVGEQKSIARFNWKHPVCLIPNGVDVPNVEHHPLAQRPLRTMLFVGRIHAIKGLPMLVEAWAQIRPVGWKMKIVGPDEAGHRAEVEALVRKAGLAADFEFTGALEGEALHRAYGDADIFILPSHTENFGMAVAEALAHGCPVIASQGSPWRGLLEHGCGWWPEISSEGLAQSLEKATSLDSSELRNMGVRGRQWMLQDFSWEHVASRMAEMYRTMLLSGRLK